MKECLSFHEHGNLRDLPLTISEGEYDELSVELALTEKARDDHHAAYLAKAQAPLLVSPGTSMRRRAKVQQR